MRSRPKRPAADSRKRVGLQSEYRFDYRASRPNRFAGGTARQVAILLDPDVATVFRDSRAVNRMLQAIIDAVRDRA